MLLSAGSIPGRSHIPGFFPTVADQPLSFPHRRVLLVVVGSQKGANSLFWVKKQHIWH